MKAMADISAGEMEEHFKVALSHFRSQSIAAASDNEENVDCDDDFVTDNVRTSAAGDEWLSMTMTMTLQTSGAGDVWLSDSGIASLLHCGKEDMDRWGTEGIRR